MMNVTETESILEIPVNENNWTILDLSITQPPSDIIASSPKCN